MGDRRNLSIPMNLVFLAGLLAASHLATATAPTQPQSATAEITAANSASSPPPTVEPVDDLSDVGLVMTLTTVAMPALPDVVLQDTPVAGAPVQKAPAIPMPVPEMVLKPVSFPPTPMIPRPANSTPPGLPPLLPNASGPNPPNPPSIVPMETAKLAALDLASPLSPEPRLVALELAPTPMPLNQTDEVVPVSGAGSDAMPKLSLAPLAPNRPGPWNAMPAALPVGRVAASSSTQDQLDPVVTPGPVTNPELPQFVRPRASDLQAAGRLMNDAAQKLSLEFLWPADRRGHSRIYSRLTECLGVEIGVIDRNGKVYVGTGGGRVLNAALHSPFIRLIDQPVDPRESRNIKRIRSGLQITAKNGTAVRVFRRAQDIRLIAALNRAFGGLPKSGIVTAEYQMEAGVLYLGKLTMNGRRHNGRVRLDHDSCI